MHILVATRNLAENSGRTAKRARRGRPFPPGVSGNPGGRPAEAPEVRALARQHTEEAIRTLVRIMRSGTPDRTRSAAAEAILDRAWGRSAQAVEASGPGGGPIPVTSLDYSRLTDEELEEFHRVYAKLLGEVRDGSAADSPHRNPAESATRSPAEGSGALL